MTNNNNITKEKLQLVYNNMPEDNPIRGDIGVVLGFWDSIIILAQQAKEHQDAIK